jgi:hypothetical protein
MPGLCDSAAALMEAVAAVPEGEGLLLGKVGREREMVFLA